MVGKTVVREHFIKYIDSILQNNKVSHAYLIELDDYEDSYEYVINFIKMIVCNLSYEDVLKSDDPRIQLIDSGNYSDLTVISTNTSVINKNLIIDLQKEFKNKSIYGNKRIYIIKEAEKLNSSSANTILKFLEEPEDDIIAILLTDNRYHVIDTILSRCQVLSLKENDHIDSIDDSIIDVLECVLFPNKFFLGYKNYIKDVFVDKNIVIDQLHSIELILLAYLSHDDVIMNRSDVIHLISSFDTTYFIHILKIIEEELPKLSFNVNFKLWLDSFFARLIGG